MIYNPYGTPPTQTVTFGSGDTDVFTYDANTSRMTKYQFNVGTAGLSDSGTLTWNANSTLQQLAITDGFNSGDNQTCTYGYDDVVRLTSANCGSVQAQTFTYDPFGNITKVGNPGQSFQPVYSMTSNRISTVGSTTAQYDNNGNVLNDGVHTYTWDADGNSITVDSVAATFDALDRMVEQNRSNSYTQIVYSPTGAKLALMSGQTLQKAFVPLPGQATAVYTSTGLDHYRHPDWLGSARLTSSPTRTVLSTTAYAPFGETYAQSGTADPSFTGQNSSTVPGDYDFLYREYSTQGRWPSPDPAGLTAATPGNPQSWNRYAYVMNNPLGAIDPLGLDCQFEDGYSYQCWQYDASYNSLVSGVPPSGPTLITTASSNTGETLLYGCSGPSGAKNQATNCGYQGGGGINAALQQYLNNYYTQQAESIGNPNQPAAISLSNISPLLWPYVKPTSTSAYTASWASFYTDLDMWDMLTSPLPPLLTQQYIKSQSLSAATQSAVQQSCSQAAQAINTFEKNNPGLPVPPGLLQAASTCAQVALPVH